LQESLIFDPQKSAESHDTYDFDQVSEESGDLECEAVDSLTTVKQGTVTSATSSLNIPVM